LAIMNLHAAPNANSSHSTCAVTTLLQAFKAARPHHWAKNLLVVAPVLSGHRWQDATAWTQAGLCFAGFSALASAVYVLNDILDRDADRKHPSKQYRPVASGALSVPAATLLSVALALVGIVIARMLPESAAWVLGIYVIASVVYSTLLKSHAIVDVIALGSFYTLRVLAGGFAAGIRISPWTLAFSMFIFLSVALAKRYVEVDRHGPSERRGYLAADSSVLLALGVGTGLLAVQVLALYINSPEVRQVYSRPEVLWLMCPVMLCWIGRVWLIAGRGELNDDPLIFAFKDPGSYVTGVLTATIILAAT
jgi:4-hydroxybenzoate polyprenyltransferase